jgi:hypothetical protein
MRAKIALKNVRKDCIAWGRIGPLEGAKDKLFFILFYLKIYSTINLGTFIFNIAAKQG